MSRELPAFPHLDHLRKQAKAHLRELCRGNPAAKLAAAQHAIAHEYGFATWPELKAHVESRPSSPAAAQEDAALRAFDGAASHTGLFGRYTEKARGALHHARCEADQYRSPRIEPEHVLLGLIHRFNDSARREGRDLPGRLFERSHLSVETVRNEIERRLQEKILTQKEMAARDRARLQGIG